MRRTACGGVCSIPTYEVFEESVQRSNRTTWEPLVGFEGLWKRSMSPFFSSLLVMRLAYVSRLPVQALVPRFQAMETRPEQSVR
ncbi:hypothetical protein BEH93_08830 [Streptomyces sp. 2R]|nr:hypothetical protein BEH93_08830 [Streptomyces sp. 2R]